MEMVAGPLICIPVKDAYWTSRAIDWALYQSATVKGILCYGNSESTVDGLHEATSRSAALALHTDPNFNFFVKPDLYIGNVPEHRCVVLLSPWVKAPLSVSEHVSGCMSVALSASPDVRVLSYQQGTVLGLQWNVARAGAWDRDVVGITLGEMAGQYTLTGAAKL